MPKTKPQDAALGEFDRLPDAAYVRLPTVATLYGCSQSNVWRLVKAGKIPAPRKLSAQTTVWNVAELRRSLAALQVA